MTPLAEKLLLALREGPVWSNSGRIWHPVPGKPALMDCTDMHHASRELQRLGYFVNRLDSGGSPRWGLVRPLQILGGWERLSDGADGSLHYGVEVKVLQHDPSSGTMERFHINDCVFRRNREEFQSMTGATFAEYDRLLADLEALPKAAQKSG